MVDPRRHSKDDVLVCNVTIINKLSNIVLLGSEAPISASVTHTMSNDTCKDDSSGDQVLNIPRKRQIDTVDDY